MRGTHWTTGEVLLWSTEPCNRPNVLGSARLLIDNRKKENKNASGVMKKLMEHCLERREAKAVFETVFFFRDENGRLPAKAAGADVSAAAVGDSDDGDDSGDDSDGASDDGSGGPGGV